MPDDPYVASKALYHVDRLAEIQKGNQIAPTLLQVDPEAYCNDNCSFCSYREETMYNTQMLDLIDAKVGDTKKLGPVGKPTIRSGWPREMAQIIPQQMKEAGIPAIEITGGGEPTLWQGFDELITNCVNKGIEIGVVTNGSNLSEDRADLFARFCTWVRVSMDAARVDTHQKVHRTQNQDFERRLQNIDRLVHFKKLRRSAITIGISFVVQPANISELESACIIYRARGVDNLRFAFMYDKTGKAGLNDQQYQELMPRLAELKAKYSTDTFAVLFDANRLPSFIQPNNDFKKCHIQKFVWAVGADLKVYPCCIMKYHPDFAYADLRQISLADMVKSADFIAKQNGLDVTKCSPCWLRYRNMAISQALEKPKHHNFL